VAEYFVAMPDTPESNDHLRKFLGEYLQSPFEMESTFLTDHDMVEFGIYVETNESAWLMLQLMHGDALNCIAEYYCSITSKYHHRCYEDDYI